MKSKNIINWDLIMARVKELERTKPDVTDYCLRCGESPESGTHLFAHNYVDPKWNLTQIRASVNMHPMKMKIYRILFWTQIHLPFLAPILDRVAHALGFCLGHS